MQKLYIFLFLVLSRSVFGQVHRQEPAPKLPTLPPETIPTINVPEKPTPIPTTSSTQGAALNITSPSASPEAGQKQYLQDIPVNLYTGTPIINIPIANLSEGGIGVNVGLSYNASGIRAGQVAEWTGLGWSLEGIPTLTRIVRGLPDEGKLDWGSWTSVITRSGYYTRPYITGTSNTDDDRELDIFLLNLGGSSYRFMFDENQKVHFFPETDIKVGITTTLRPDGANGLVKDFTQFLFTLANGTQYVFTNENTEQTIEVEVKYSQYNGVYPSYNHANFDQYWKANGLVSTWYAKKIRSAYGQEIKFYYAPISYSYFKLLDGNEGFECALGTEKYVNRVFVKGFAIDSIVGINKVISFNDGKTICTPDLETGDTYCHSISKTRLDIDDYTQFALSSSSTSKVLENIAYYDKNAPNDKLVWTFSTGYFSSDATKNSGYDLPNHPYTYTYNDVGHSHEKRLKLTGITFPDGNVYNLSYYGDWGNFAFKTRFTFGIDHWGYMNGHDNNFDLTGLVGNDYVYSCVLGSNRNVETSYASYGVLYKIVSTTGSETTLTYESNQAKNFSFFDGSYTRYEIGGLRIKQIESKDLLNGTAIVKKYDYTLSSGGSSGFLFVKPLYHFTGIDGNPRANSILFPLLVSQSGRSIVGYGRVVESIYDASNNFLSKSISYFEQDETEQNITIQAQKCPTNNPNCGVYITAYWPSAFINNYDTRAGFLYQIENYNQNNTLVSEIDYIDNGYGVVSGGYNAVRVVKLNGQTYTWNYIDFFRSHRMVETIAKIYSPDGSGTFSSTTTGFIYKDEMPLNYQNTYQGKHNQVVKIRTTDSYGYIQESLVKYASDISFDTDSVLVAQTCTVNDQWGEPYTYSCPYYTITTYIPYSGTEARGIYELQQKGITGAVLETSVKKNNKIVSATYQNYYADNSSYVGLPKSSYSLRSLGNGNFSDMVYNKFTQEFSRDANYGNERSTILSYNALGLLQSSQIRHGSISQTNYGNDKLSILNQIQNVGKSDALTTSYVNTGRFNNLSKIISSNNISVNYTYDAIGRLISKNDQNNSILSKYIYNHQSTNGISLISFDNSIRTKSCVNGQIILTVYVVGLASGANLQFSIDGNTWQSANVGVNGFSYTLSPTASYLTFQAKASDNPSTIISTQYYVACTTSLNWSANSCTVSNGNSLFYVSVTGLATDSYAEFSLDGITWYKANSGVNGYTVSVAYGTGGLQSFYARPAESPSLTIQGWLTKCN